MARAVAAVSEAELAASERTLVGFGTRHTLSDTSSPVRGIGAARRWARERLEAAGRACGGCLAIETPARTVTGARIPSPTRVEDVIAVQRGTTDPDRVVIISGHIDSLMSDFLDGRSDAPGADDDASGTSAVLEAARVLSRHRFPATIVYAVLSGEEQGLYGGRILAETARAHGWRVEAVLNNDIVGGTHGSDGRVEDRFVRVFSEGVRADETADLARERRRTGAENDAPSRELARFIRGVAGTYGGGFGVRMVFRADRFHRGGDQGPMQDAGYPAVRLTEADENYAREHQRVRVENGVAYGDVLSGVDIPYLARVTRLNVAALASLAKAPAPPEGVTVKGDVTPDTTLAWSPVPGAAGYRVWWRETTDPDWRFSRDAGAAAQLFLKGINIDDYDFGVAAYGRDGLASPVVFPGAPGAFTPASAPATPPAAGRR